MRCRLVAGSNGRPRTATVRSGTVGSPRSDRRTVRVGAIHRGIGREQTRERTQRQSCAGEPGDVGCVGRLWLDVGVGRRRTQVEGEIPVDDRAVPDRVLLPNGHVVIQPLPSVDQEICGVESSTPGAVRTHDDRLERGPLIVARPSVDNGSGDSRSADNGVGRRHERAGQRGRDGGGRGWCDVHNDAESLGDQTPSPRVDARHVERVAPVCDVEQKYIGRPDRLSGIRPRGRGVSDRSRRVVPMNPARVQIDLVEGTADQEGSADGRAGGGVSDRDRAERGRVGQASIPDVCLLAGLARSPMRAVTCRRDGFGVGAAN